MGSVPVGYTPPRPAWRFIERIGCGETLKVRARTPRGGDRARQADRSGLDGQPPDGGRKGIRRIRRGRPRTRSRGEATRHGAGHRTAATAPRARAQAAQGRAPASFQSRLATATLARAEDARVREPV